MSDSSLENLYQTRSLSLIHGDWSLLLDQSARLVEENFHAEALLLARAIMHRAASQIARLVTWLHETGYDFAHRDRIWQRPLNEDEVRRQINAAAKHGVHFPISYQAFLFEVGSVNLMGSHPDWPFRGYNFDDERLGKDKPHLCSDPLVVEFSPDYPAYLKSEWDARVRDMGISQAGPLCYDFSPDHLHKAAISGGAPYSFAVDKPRVDPLVYDCRHCGTFVGHLRNSLAWGGFPGLEYIDVELEAQVDPRKIGLLPI